MGKEIRILTDIKARVSTAWKEKTDFWPELQGGRGVFSDFMAAARLLYFSQKYDITVVASNRSGNIFAMMSTLWPGTKPLIMMVDCLWYRPRNRLLLWMKRLQIQIMARAVNKFIVWASHEVRDYATTFNIPEEKLLCIPFHHTLEGYKFEASNGDYIFSGGDGDRDYETLLRAVEGSGVRVIIATRLSNWNGNIAVPEHIKAFPTSHADFRKLMAGSKMVVVPMQRGLLHSGGQQTYLNAMAMGKPVVVADDLGAKDYIQSGTNGLIVPAGDVGALRTAIKSVLDNPVLAAKLSNNARNTYVSFSTTKCMETILRTAEEIALGDGQEEIEGMRG
jgi:hypothetical protein